MKISSSAAAVLLTLAAFGASAEKIAVVEGTVIDGNGGKPIAHGVIVIDGERIVAVGGRGTPIPDGARRIDAKGKYIIPGLMDANVHLIYGWSTDFLIRFESRLEDIIREGAQVALKSGVTTVFDSYGPLVPLKTVRDEIDGGKLDAARIFLAGNIVGLSGPFSNDFYAEPKSVGKQTIQRLNAMYEHGTGKELVYMAPEQVRSTIRAYLDNGMDFVKYAASGHASSEFGLILFSPRVQRIIVEEAHLRGLTVQTHTMSIESLHMAVEAGVDLMQHCDTTVGQPMPDDLVRLIADKKIPCAMIIYPQRYMRNALHAGSSAVEDSIAGAQGRAQTVTMDDLQAITQINRRKLIDAGATVLLSTDGGVAYEDEPLLQEVFFQRAYPEIREDLVGFFGAGHAAWLRGAAEAGLSPMRVLQAATRNIAAAYKKLSDLGTLERGKIADLVILNADPLSDPTAYAAIHRVIKSGKIVDRDALPTVKVLTQKQ